MRILLLESDLILAQALSEALREVGYDPIGPVSEVNDAITLAEQFRPDLALINIDLPAGPGLGVVVARTIARNWNIKSLFTSGDKEIARRNRDVAFGYLSSPATVSELVECIEAIKLIRKGEFPMKIPKRLSPFL
jgi:DNA-binding NarL/FixJ family response regulator